MMTIFDVNIVYIPPEPTV